MLYCVFVITLKRVEGYGQKVTATLRLLKIARAMSRIQHSYLLVIIIYSYVIFFSFKTMFTYITSRLTVGLVWIELYPLS